jgi:NADPH-dependent 2,4-dienoyl-CoA reductase/sulfur reductase-like enzyme
VTHYTYLIIGGGMTGSAAANGIREQDSEGSIGIISTETHMPYDRPPLSKKLWTGKKKVEDIFRPVPADVGLHLGRKVTSLQLEPKQATTDDGQVYTFDKLLLATGGRPRHLPFGGDNIIYYRSLNTYERLRGLTDAHERFAVIGGGFIGSELAAALAMQGKQVTILFPEAGICDRLFPSDLVEFLNDYYREKGVEVLPGMQVTGLEGTGTSLRVVTGDGRRLPANGVVAGIGIQLNTALAEQVGLELDDKIGGIKVDSSLQTSHPDVYAAGDVASYPDALLDTRRRVEHEDAANTMGKTAGRIMAGADVIYDHTPYFYSDMFELGYEAVGRLDSRLETVADWQEPFRKGVIYYLEDGRVRGVLLWDVWDKVPQATELIAAAEQVKPADLKGRIQ